MTVAVAQTMAEVPNLVPAIPEMLLAAAAMVLLLVGVFRGDCGTRGVSWAAVAVLAVAAFFVVSGPGDGTLTFADMFIADRFAVFMKVLVLLGSALTLVISLDYIRQEGVERFEYPVLILLATLGMLMMVAAADLISLYVGLELQSLALYVLAAFKRDSERSTEAGLKYFVLGALASGILLYGASLVYGFTGTTNFEAIAANIAGGEGPSTGLLFGLAFLVAGLAFKVAAVPFHMWTPDVYEGAPTPITAFFSVAPKIAAFALFVRVMVGPFGGLVEDWTQIIVVLSALSMVLGAFAAIGQRNIKRMMAYSSIGHVGFALMGLAAGSEKGVQGLILYLTIYLAMNVGAWAVILNMRRGNEGMVEEIGDLAGLARRQPMMALAMAIFMFSLAGIPPLAGFFAKFYVLLAAIDAGLYTLAVIAVLAAVVGSYYYLRVVKLMYFDEPAEKFSAPVREVAVVIAAAAVFTLFFFMFPAPFVGGAEVAALALFP